MDGDYDNAMGVHLEVILCYRDISMFPFIMIKEHPFWCYPGVTCHDTHGIFNG